LGLALLCDLLRLSSGSGLTGQIGSLVGGLLGFHRLDWLHRLGAGLRFRRQACLLGLCLTRFFGFAFFALANQLFFLATQQLRLTTGFFLTTRQFGFVDHRRGGHIDRRSRCLGDFVVALDEGALLANLDLDGARAARSVGLLDFRGRLFDQGDLLALATRSAVGGLEMVEQRLLVGFGHDVRGSGLAHAGSRQLLQQQGSGFVEFIGELGDGGTGHGCVSPLGPPWFSSMPAFRRR